MKSREWPGGSVGGVPLFNPANTAQVEKSNERAKQRGPSAFTVVAVDLTNGDNCVELGHFWTKEAARSCVSDNGLTEWEIWQGDHIVEESGPSIPVVKCPRCSTPTRGLVKGMNQCEACAES